jgi:hypothetical protein
MTSARIALLAATLLASVGCGGSESNNQCGAGMAMCGVSCIDVTADTNNCGSCGNVCSGTTPFCVDSACAATCGFGDIYCAGVGCVDAASDEQNCGGCGNDCGTAGTCNSGVCMCTPGPGILMCGAECADIASDVDHCGSCFNDCNANETCTSGVCVCSDPAFMNCGGCVDTTVDPSDCGSCGNGCNDDQICQGSICVCRPPLVAGPGGCTDPTSDPGACGTPPVVCEGATPFCQAGVCVDGCADGFEVCAGGTLCINTDVDPLHCGGCGEICNSDEVCVEGNCRNYDIALGGSCDTCSGNEACCTLPGTTTQICVEDGTCPAP